MSLSPQENAKRIRRAVEKLRDAARAKSAAVDHFGQTGTLGGFDYRTVGKPLAQQDGQPDQQQLKPVEDMTDEELLDALGR